MAINVFAELNFYSNYEFYKIHQSMRKPLLTHLLRRTGSRVLIMFAVGFGLILTSSNKVFSQAEVYSTSECSCMDNATTSTNGQYMESITITGIAGQTWRLMNVIGFYNPLSPAPPASPILYLNNTVVPETAPGSGVYTISGLRVSGQNWTVTLTNGSVIKQLSSAHSCSYPSAAETTISGDDYVCQVSSETYTIPGGLLENVTWELTDGGMITSSTSTSATVTWGAIPGDHFLIVRGIRKSYSTQTDGCEFEGILKVKIFDKADITIHGDFGNCIGAKETYSIPLSLSQINPATIQWSITLDAAGNVPSGILSTGSAIKQTVQWPSTPGVYYIHVSGSAIVGNNQCSVYDVQRVDIVDEANHSMACNNLVQVSMNPSCELKFRPDQFLEDPYFPESSYDIIIRDIEADTIIPTGTIGYGYINKTVEVKIMHECSGNSCWGLAKIEDKSILELVCPEDVTIECQDLDDFSITGMPDFPLGTVVTPRGTSPQTWLLVGYDMCSDVILKYSDEAITGLCDGPYSSVITRTWVVTDANNNSSECDQTIFVERASIFDVQFPLNYDDATGPYGSLEACGSWPKVPYIKNGIAQTYTLNGKIYLDSVPSPDYTGWPQGTLCLKSAVVYTDTKLPICENNPLTYKLIRRWKVIDHCTSQIRDSLQFISVMDTQPPVGTAPADLVNQVGTITPAAVINVTEHTCTAMWNVLPPIVVYDCSPTTWEVGFKLADSNGQPPANADFVKVNGSTQVTGTYPNFKIINLPAGRTWVRYKFTDLCGNYSYAFTEIDVVDNEPPTPVCDKNSVIAIPSDGMAFAGVLTFDDGSHDNCALDYLKVRRMDNPVDWSTLDKNNEIKFTCNDVSNTVIVELAVWDKNGASNSCMVEAKVQDNIAPVLEVPGTATAYCYSDLVNLSRFGSATVTDNCSATVRDSIVRDINECNLGYIERWFIAKDKFGNTVKKRQLIKVVNDKPLTYNDIDWPDTYNTTSSCVSNLDPDDLSYPYDRPKLKAGSPAQCSQLAMSYEDIVFNFADNVCVKILRKWTVIDWCQRNGFDPTSGTFTNTQLIMVNNTVGPVILSGCDNSDLNITQVGDCKANIKVTAVASDDCTPEDNLTWTYTIDFNNDGVVDITNGTGRTINRDFSYGTHKIVWRVEDACKNFTTCPNIFTIDDDKKPTPYCISEIVTVIMPTTKSVTIWASDFDKGATDNCSSGSQITASFSGTNRTDISRTITCADLDGQTSKEFSYDVYAIDAKGNYDFCTVKLKVQDNNNSCEDPKVGQKNSISGQVIDIKNIPMSDVEVELNAGLPEYPRTGLTSTLGQYTFGDVVSGNDYSVRPIKNNDLLNGVSTLDLVYIQRHILGIEYLETPSQLLAADVNNSKKISAADLSDLRKAILGINTNFPNNDSWRFLPSSAVGGLTAIPYNVDTKIDIYNISKDQQGVDFVGVKIGDVNQSADANANGSQTASRAAKILVANYTYDAATQIVEAVIEGENINNVLGAQFGLRFNPSEYDLLDVTPLKVNVRDENINYSGSKDGMILFSWNAQDKSVNFDSELFKITFRYRGSGSPTSVLTLTNESLNSELYTEEQNVISTYDVTWRNSGLEGDSQFELFQNVPNPYSNNTSIGFVLPEAGHVVLSVSDLAGRMVYKTEGNYQKGYNVILLDTHQLNASGVLLYQLDTQKDSAIRKMIVIK